MLTPEAKMEVLNHVFLKQKTSLKTIKLNTLQDLFEKTAHKKIFLCFQYDDSYKEADGKSEDTPFPILAVDDSTSVHKLRTQLNKFGVRLTVMRGTVTKYLLLGSLRDTHNLSHFEIYSDSTIYSYSLSAREEVSIRKTCRKYAQDMLRTFLGFGMLLFVPTLSFFGFIPQTWESILFVAFALLIPLNINSDYYLGVQK